MTGRSAALVARQAAALDDACGCRFVREATEGELSDGDFARYLVIEEAFVLTAARVLGRVVWESPSWGTLLPHARSLTNLVTDQRDYFAALRDRWPVDAVDAAATQVRARSLSDVVLTQVAADGRPAAVTGMLAAETMYARWCTAAAGAAADAVTRRHPDLQAWIDLHTGPDFLAQVNALSDDVDALDPDEVTDEDLDRWFRSVLRAEIEFHDAVHG
ncbi:thiaminase/transcriptional activator TenA [Blastococcus colisei]|uniref:Thiaminase/transcriptional activator TenA n=1 Tax=Blastococcus colisei TaxID=1564162 RepID=A0A543PJG8_9ACTN|nr:TenA family protein [Blastococcus colisei]TQN44199.1 thiaminase/transcriptional activator TenA [Blastococcus colisei]